MRLPDIEMEAEAYGYTPESGTLKPIQGFSPETKTILSTSGRGLGQGKPRKGDIHPSLHLSKLL